MNFILGRVITWAGKKVHLGHENLSNLAQSINYSIVFTVVAFETELHYVIQAVLKLTT